LAKPTGNIEWKTNSIASPHSFRGIADLNCSKLIYKPQGGSAGSRSKRIDAESLSSGGLSVSFFRILVRPSSTNFTNFQVATALVARTNDLQPGDMRLVEVSGKKILLLRTFDSQWHALSRSCPHAGAPLEKGTLCGTRLICPWHKSCFAASDGALLESPSLESLQTYFLEIVGEDIRVDPEWVTQRKQLPRYPKFDSRPNATFVILGGGAAAAAAVRELRDLGFAGRLVMVSQEMRAPYDRTLLSKMYLSGHADSKQLPLCPETLLMDCQVEFLVAEIESVDPEKFTIRFKDTLSSLDYDEVLVATGGRPKLLPLPVSESQPLILRHVDDANRLIAAAEHAENALLVGAREICV
jgi:nitrite reductase/ring-hydroxylating ferredoxin subunit